MEVLVEKEIIAYGPTTAISTVLSNIPVKPRTVKVFVDVGASELSSGYDNGSGVISGTGFSGNVSYSTGEISLTLSTAIPDDTRYAFVTYTYFSVGVTELNLVQYANEDFQTNVETLKEFLRKNYPEDYNDYVNSSLGMALIDINAYMAQNLFWYMNRKVTDLYFPTAKTPNNISKIARNLGYKPSGSSSSQVSLTVTLKNGPYLFAVQIQKPFAFKATNGLQYEYRNTVPVTFAPGEITKTFDVNEGQSTVDNFVSNGETNQIIYLRKVPENRFIEEGSVVVKINGTTWTEYPIIPFEKITAFETNLLSYPPYVKFGDGIQGQIPTNGAGIEISYVICNGFNGRVAKESIATPVTPLNVSFTEIPLTIYQGSASIGGENPEDNRSITVNAPLFQRTQDRAITKGDYDWLSTTYPNVSKADAQVIRSVEQDYVIQSFLNQMNTHVINLKNSDRYLHPQPQISNLVFSENLFENNTISVDIDTTTYSQTFDTDNTNTLNLLAAQIATHSKVSSAIVRECTSGNVIVITGKDEVTFSVSNISVTEGTVSTITVTELTPAPNQTQQIMFGSDLFYGNIVSLNYASVPLSIPFDTDSSTTIQNLAAAIRGFASAPTGSWKEIGTAPNQSIEMKFDKAFFNGNLIQIKLTDLSLETPVETLVEVSFRTNNLITYSDLATALSNLSFISSSTPDSVNNKITFAVDSSRPQTISKEIVAFGNGTLTAFTSKLENYPVKSGTLKITAGSIIGVDNGLGAITGTGISSGTINYATGDISITYTSAPALGLNIYAEYMYHSSSATVEVNSITVTTNTVTVDETLRTIDIVTDGSGSLSITGESVSGKSAPSITTNLVQSMISEDLGSVGAIASDIQSQISTLESYLNESMTSGCNSNTVQVSVLSLDAAKKYAAPTQTLLDSLQSYLTERKDIVHHVECYSGYDRVINVDISVEVLVNANSVQDEVVKKIERSLIQSDSIPYGLMVQRDFNKSVYVSEIFDAIQNYVSDSERDYINIIISGPAQHITGLIQDELIGIGDGTSSISISTSLKYKPIVSSSVKISVNGVIVGEDNGESELVTVSGGGYTVSGMIDYSTGLITPTVTPSPSIGEEITVTYYQSKIDSRGNYICPTGYVLQYGTVAVTPLSRTSI